MKAEGLSTATAMKATSRRRSRSRSAGRAEMISCGDNPWEAMSSAALRARSTTSR
jgi:hypothetical protein